MFCPFCGKETDPAYGFCTNCGGKLSAAAMPPPPAPQYSYPAPPVQRTVKFSTFLIVVGILSVLLVFSVAGLITTAGLLGQAEARALHPTVAMWNACAGPCTMTAGSWRAGGVPDTFDYHVSFNATVPVAVYFLTLNQYVQFVNCGGKVSCVSGTYYSYSAATIVQGTFTLAEGCGSYIAVFQSAQNGVISPDISVTYNPASQPTGVCAG